MAKEKVPGIKTTAGEYDNFLEASWKDLGIGEDPYIEEDEIYAEGELDTDYEPRKYPPETVLHIGGTTRDQAPGVNSIETEHDLGKVFQKWRKLQTKAQIVLEVDLKTKTKEEWQEYLTNLLGKDNEQIRIIT